MAAVMKVTANGTTTSPGHSRGLGGSTASWHAAAQAHGGRGGRRAGHRGATTIREQLAKHRQRAECASCHIKIDPPGFALESFDVIGGWRDYYRSVGQGEPAVVNGRKARLPERPGTWTPVDVLPDGQEVQDIDEFKQLLLKEQGPVGACIHGETTDVHAPAGLPRAPTKPEIDTIVANIRARDYGFRTLVHASCRARCSSRSDGAVVDCPRLFQHKKTNPRGFPPCN